MNRGTPGTPLESGDTRAKEGNCGHPADWKPDLTQAQQRALPALLTARSVAGAARQSGVSERSLHRWLREDRDFQMKLRQLREDALGQASSHLQQGTSDASAVLYELIQADQLIESGRNTLIRSALDLAFRSASCSDLAERIAKLEQAAHEYKLEVTRGRPRTV